mgnify:CR=1 FL=1
MLPAGSEYSLTGDRDSMKQGLQRVAILSKEKYIGVKNFLKEVLQVNYKNLTLPKNYYE